jgi:serine protease
MKRFRALMIVWVLSVITLSWAAAAHAEPYGEQFRVNASVSGAQTPIAVASGPDAGWSIAYYDSVRSEAFVNRYDAAGRLLVSDLPIGPRVADIAVDGSGRLAVLRRAEDGSGTGVFVTLYSSTGAIIRPESRVNDTIAGDQLGFALAMNASGQFAVVWTHRDHATNAYGVYVKRFNSNGTQVAPEYAAFSEVSSTGGTFWSDIAIDAHGNFIVSWDRYDNGFATEDVWVRRFDAGGSPLGAPVRVNTQTGGSQMFGRIACNEAGAFTVVWTHQNQVGDQSWSVRGQRFGTTGQRLGGEFLVSLQNDRSWQWPGIAMARDGGFVVTWSELPITNDPSPQILARAFDRNGAAIGQLFLVNSPDELQHMAPLIAFDRDDNFVIAWRQYDSSQVAAIDTYARRFSPPGISIQPLVNHQLVTGLSGATGSFRYFKITVPQGHTTLDVSIFGGSGDADLYVRQGALPTLTRWDGRPYLWGNDEAVRMRNFPPGDWYIGVHGYSGYSSLALRASSY